jgi:hypothetical protein
MINLIMLREITPYKSVHPAGDDAAAGLLPLARPIREGTVFLVRLTRPQASSDEAHRIAFGFHRL